MAINIEVDDPRFWNSDVANLARLGLTVVRISHLSVTDEEGKQVILRGPELGREIDRLQALVNILQEKYDR